MTDFTTGPNSYGPPPTSDSSSSGTGTGGSSSSTTATDGSGGELSTSQGSSSTGGFFADVGSSKDFGGDDLPVGCQGKIDFLFVISSYGTMLEVQEQLVAALPEFIETIESKFDDFDYHIMVAHPGKQWGLPRCTNSCPDLSCMGGDPCCSDNDAPKDKLCCDVPGYPCKFVDLVTECDEMVGAGVVLPSGFGASNTLCKIAGGHRYLTKGQPNLIETFTCIAKLGISGNNLVGDALVSAVSIGYNGPLGCNTGFLRDDALLMITMVTPGSDSSVLFKDHMTWYERLLKAKNGDPKSIVMFLIGQAPGPCLSGDEPCKLAQMLPYNLAEDGWDKDYGPSFDKATDLLVTACEQLIPQ